MCLMMMRCGACKNPSTAHGVYCSVECACTAGVLCIHVSSFDSSTVGLASVMALSLSDCYSLQALGL